MAELKDRRHERVAQLLSVMKTPEQASLEAGYNAKAKSFASNARKRACRPDIKARVSEILSIIAACTIIDAAWIKGKVAAIAGVDVDPANIKVSDMIAALNLLAKMTPGALAPEKVTLTDADGMQGTIKVVLVDPAPRATSDFGQPYSAS